MEENKPINEEEFSKTLLNAIGLPWTKGEKPYFINPEGYEWYLDKDTTQWAQREDTQGTKLPNIIGFFVRKGDDAQRVLMDKSTNQVIYSSTNLEAVSCHIDMLKALERYEQ